MRRMSGSIHAMEYESTEFRPIGCYDNREIHVERRPMNFSIEHEHEADGRWLAEVPELPGVLSYGATAEEAMAKVEALALRVIAERLEHGESRPMPIHFSITGAA